MTRLLLLVAALYLAWRRLNRPAHHHNGWVSYL